VQNIYDQTFIFIFAVTIGFFIGALYDIFRILRKVFKHPDFLTQIEDFVFWIVVTGVMFYLMLNRNYGEIRGFTILGTMLGALLYFATISTIVLNMSVKIINFLLKILSTVTKIILFPLKVVMNILKIPLNMLKSVFTATKKPIKKVLQKSSSYAKIKAIKAKKDINIIMKKI